MSLEPNGSNSEQEYDFFSDLDRHLLETLSGQQAQPDQEPAEELTLNFFAPASPEEEAAAVSFAAAANAETNDAAVIPGGEAQTEDVPEKPQPSAEAALSDTELSIAGLLSDPIAEPDREPAPEPIPEKKKRTRAVKKGRPRRRNGEGLWGIPNILVTVVWCALTLLISLTLGRLVWVCAAEVLAFGREDRNVTVTIYENDSIEEITRKLAKEGLIRYPGLFQLYAKYAVDDGEIRPGMWDLNTKYDYHALVKMMSPSSTREVIKVTIPEGYTCRQIFSLLEDNKVCNAKDIEEYAAYGELNYFWFLDNVTRGDKYCLEGFLFPDTYEFYKNDSPKNVLTRMLNNFNNRFDEDMQWKIQNLNAHITDLMRRNGSSQDYINAHQFTVRDVVNVAAMIEKETSSVQEGYTIASVIYNRLFCWGSNPRYLGIDATIVYATGGDNEHIAQNLYIDSPYNTYRNEGLPIGPIANPGLSSLKAALEPSDTNYYFYVWNPAIGSHHFSTTQAEHDAYRASMAS